MKGVQGGSPKSDHRRPQVLTPSCRSPLRSRLEVSYSSTLLLVWAGFLAVLSWQSGFHFQAAATLIFCSIALTSIHGESRLLFPFLFLSERCLGDALHQRQAPSEFYASMFLSYLTLVACKSDHKQTSWLRQWMVLEVLLYAGVGIAGIFFIWKEEIDFLGAAVFVAVGYTFFQKLRLVLDANEAVLIGTLVGFYLGDVVTNNNLSMHGGRESVLNFSAPGNHTSNAHVAGRAVALSSIYLLGILSMLSRFCLVPINKNSKSSDRRISRRRISCIFFVSLLMIVTVMGVLCSYHFQQNAVWWLIEYVVSSRFRRYTMMLWVTCIPVAILAVDMCTQTWKQTVRRKMFHCIAVVAFTPPAILDPSFLSFSLSVAAGLTVIVEVARYYQVYGANAISRYLCRHIDGRDHIHGVVRTHIYLLIGLGVSPMLRYRHEFPDSTADPSIIELSMNIIPGIISLGIVDAGAAIIGSSYLLEYRRTLGRYLKNPVFTERANFSITHKTTTGTIGGFVCGLVFWLFILIITKTPLLAPAWYTFAMIIVCTLTECFMDDIDNLQLPLVVLGAVNTWFAFLLRFPLLWTGNDTMNTAISDSV